MNDSPTEPGAQPVGVEPSDEGEYEPIVNTRRNKWLRVNSDNLFASPRPSFVIQITPIQPGKSLNRLNALKIAKKYI